MAIGHYILNGEETMYKLIGVMITLMMLFYTNAQSLEAESRTREEIPEKYKWDLSDLYENEKAWETAKDQLLSDIDRVGDYEGKLSESAESLYSCLELLSDLYKEYYRLSTYASRLHDQDTRESEPQAMTQSMNQVGTRLSSATSFIDPEILSMEPEIIRDFLEEHEGLRVYEHYLDDLQRQSEHTLSPSEEKIISEAGLMSGAPYDIYGIFKNADMPRPVVEIEGEDVRLDDAAYTLHRANQNREVRRTVFDEFFGMYEEFERTFGTKLAAQVNKDLFYKNVRKYDSCLERALDANNIPTDVYHSLIESVNENLPTLHRYLRLRKKLLDVDTLRYYDIYPSMFKEVDLEYEVEEAQGLITSALQPLGSDYVETLDRAFGNRWIDMYPTSGKRSGAYSSGSAYDVHPYILMNFNGQYEDVSTLAHELGHTMHSYYSNENQHIINANYPIFLAEVASTTNEALLVDHMLDTLDDPAEQLAILGNELESLRGVLFRQTQFAEFELKIHEMVENGESLTGEKLTETYLDILRKYYGHDEGVMYIDEKYGIEWAYIPHFYYNFYVYQYATSYCAATMVSEKILSGDGDMRTRYIDEFLSAGGSDYPIPILQNIGVDMTTTRPYERAFQKMETVIDRIETLLAQVEQ